jgi:hypothetical protein
MVFSKAPVTVEGLKLKNWGLRSFAGIRLAVRMRYLKGRQNSFK